MRTLVLAAELLVAAGCAASPHSPKKPRSSESSVPSPRASSEHTRTPDPEEPSVTPIRYPPRPPLDPATIPDLELVSAICDPTFDEVDGRLGCRECPDVEGEYPASRGGTEPGVRVRRGPSELRMEEAFRGSFGAPGSERALVRFGGCGYWLDWAVLLEKRAERWSLLQWGRAVEFKVLSPCVPARSQKFGDSVVCRFGFRSDRVGLTFTNGRREVLFGAAVVSLNGQGAANRMTDGISDDLFFIREPSACEDAEARGRVVHAYDESVVAQDVDADGSDDVVVNIRYRIVPQPTPDICDRETLRNEARLVFLRTAEGFRPTSQTSRLLKLLGAE